MFKTTDGGSNWNVIDSYLNSGRALLIAPSDNNIIFAGGSNYNETNVMAVCYSRNVGTNWTRVELTTERGYVYTMAIHPTNPNIVLAGGYCYDGSKYIGKIFKSTNGGENWTDVSSGVSERYNYVYSLAFDPNDDNILYAGCSNGIFKSTDSGINWSDLNASFSNVYNIAIDQNTSKIYVGCYFYGVYSSSDGGQNWTEMNEGLNSLELDCMILDSDNQLLYIGTRNSGTFRYDLSSAVEQGFAQTTIPAKIKLLPNYPNPFNPKTTINFEISGKVNLHVTLEIYNIYGQLVRKLVDENTGAGVYSAAWDGVSDTGVSANSGLYFCVLRAGSFSETRKMTLLK